MFSQKTKKVRVPQAFLIAAPLILLNGSILGLLTDQVISISGARSHSVKDNMVIAADESQIADQEDEPQSEILTDEKPAISLYTVKEGDTLSTIATNFSITTNTILWANDLTRASKIKVGQKLTILPVTGIQYVVKKGDTMSSIAEKFDGDVEEILSYNDLEDAGKIKIGMELIIPNGEIHVEKKVVAPPTKAAPVVKTKSVDTIPAKDEVLSQPTSVDSDDGINNGAVPPVTVRGVNTNDYFTHPVPGSVQTQGKHGYNSVDFGAPKGTPIVAAADGVVIVEKGAGKWYGGYGNHIVIEHDNGTQTLYAHNSKNLVNVGDTVKQGQTIGLVGSTGRSTGSHLHFEVRGGINPWVGKPKGTQY